MLSAVNFKVGGKSYSCIFANSAMAAYEEKYDASFLTVVERFEGEDLKSLRIGFFVELMTFAMQAAQREMSKDDIEAVIDQIRPTQLIQLVGEAIGAAFPSEEGGDGKDAAPAGKAKPARKPKK